MINTYPLPSELLNMGDALTSDTLLVLLRPASVAQPGGDASLPDGCEGGDPATDGS
jgi:hypothetical protein